jgi:hypothetical protein
MKSRTFLCAVGFVIVVGGSTQARADVYTRAPKEGGILPEDGNGVTKVALLFDLSTLRVGDNRQIDEAILDWRLSDIAEGDLPEFVTHPVTLSWTTSTVAAGAAPSCDTTRVWGGQLNPLVPETSDGKLVRFDLTEMVTAWASGESPNYGLVIAISDLSVKTLSTQLGKAQLTIRYGFREN